MFHWRCAGLLLAACSLLPTNAATTDATSSTPEAPRPHSPTETAESWGSFTGSITLSPYADSSTPSRPYTASSTPIRPTGHATETTHLPSNTHATQSGNRSSQSSTTTIVNTKYTRKPPKFKTRFHPVADFSYTVATHPTRTYFKTEPTFRPEYFEVTHITKNKSLLAPGYFFLDPMYKPMFRGKGPWGPQIYDQDGELIWHDIEHKRSQGFHVCDYLGTHGKHLCVHERIRHKDMPDASQKFHVASGMKYVLDQTYKQVSQNFTRGIRGFGTNGHEFKVVENGASFLQPVDMEKPYDLSVFNGPEEGWVTDGCLQEVDFKTSKSLFKWCWLDHLPIWMSTLYPTLTRPSDNITHMQAGLGNRAKPWDFAHVNSMDKTAEGDYLVSFRHCDQIVKIAGKNNVHGVKKGTVLWQLGSRYSDFDMDFEFSKQHSIRVHSTSATETVISLLNNDLAGTIKGPNTESNGMIISVNNVTMKATLMQIFPQPHGQWAAGKGNLEILENGNAFVGWGFLPSLSEFDKDGNLLYHAKFSAHLLNEPDMPGIKGIESSYRAFKSPWVGKPDWDPKVVAYSRTCKRENSPLVIYASWNGATEIKYWRFYSAIKAEGPWNFDGDVPKTGFETKAVFENAYFAAFVLAQALDVNGNVLGDAFAKIFVPDREYASICGVEGCDKRRFRYGPKHSKIEMCIKNQRPTYNPLIVFVLMWEALYCLVHLAWYIAAHGSRRRHAYLTLHDNGRFEELMPASEKRWLV